MSDNFDDIVSMYRLDQLCLATLLFTASGLSCSEDSSVPPAFDGPRAFSYLERQVAFGPRVPGSEAWENCRAYYNSFFDSLGLTVDSQVFHFVDPYSGVTLPLVNVMVSIAGRHTDQPGILLAAHWDCRPRCDLATDSTLAEQPLDGANDGASGVAVLMELAVLLAEQPPPLGVQFVLFDGEDWGEAGDLEYYLLGSREFARRGVRGKYRFAIVLDMIGDKDQQVYREGYSQQFSPALNDMVFDAAAGLGLTTFRDSVKYYVHDDHLSLNSGGLPAIDLIDFDYPHWHTKRDTPDKCSPDALENVGRLLVHLIYNPSLWPTN